MASAMKSLHGMTAQQVIDKAKKDFAHLAKSK